MPEPCHASEQRREEARRLHEQERFFGKPNKKGKKDRKTTKQQNNQTRKHELRGNENQSATASSSVHVCYVLGVSAARRMHTSQNSVAASTQSSPFLAPKKQDTQGGTDVDATAPTG